MEPNKNYQVIIAPDKLFAMLEQKFSGQYIFERNSPENLVVINHSLSPIASIYVHPNEINIHFINPLLLDEQEQERIYEAMDLFLEK